MPKDVGASRMGGQLTWNFSQGSYKSIIKKHPHTKGGICEALSVSWISKALQSGLRDALSTGDNIDDTKIAVVAQRFASMYRFKFQNGTEGRSSTSFEMIKETKQYLESQGFHNVGHAGSGIALKNKNPSLEEQFTASFGALEDKDYFKQQSSTLHCILRTAGNGWGHAMAFRIESSSDKVCYFFDPNKGEFKFLQYQNFKKWYQHFHRDSKTYRSSRAIGFDVFTHKDR
ncbi:YopT-type cysteine protease domain-containing protein [Microbulbifer sp. OS29]|uniref:YopT-type cysteine protease domain-containing protein n=1 Tax=Microbulbifer okhotskensis TaxID=2926617 RepID=A0A9X2J5E2_9GAMM|nr:YopT-type cysteine protease domain-containing protein [Microbulbifer okhotskensis]MCO1333495.1 YopT-type cysteine protease domain-containing protein [Microbulbifer okhotskensis]